MTCHLAYAVPLKNFRDRLRRRACLALQRCGLGVSAVGDRTRPEMRWWPAESPFENTRHMFEGLSARMPTKLYRLDEQVRCHFAPDDVFLGHPYFPFAPGARGVTERSIGSSPRPAVFALISPLHCDTTVETTHINRAYLEAVDRLLPQADVFFAIMGRYWWDQWPTSPFAHWMPKLFRLDMAIDAARFPRVKTRFNPPGRRGFLYIGRNDPMKGIEFLRALARDLHEARFGWIGPGPEIPGVRRISDRRPLTPEFMKQVAAEYDVFVSPSLADPNPTTILESMAWGFPAACTPQSGYYATDFRRSLFRDDQARSVEVLRHMQFAEVDEMERMADAARQEVERTYTWERFVGTICSRLGLE